MGHWQSGAPAGCGCRAAGAGRFPAGCPIGAVAATRRPGGGLRHSAPELAVNLQASLSGQADFAIGNVAGSNIFNILIVLGLSALIAPLVIAPRALRFDLPLAIGLSVLALGLGFNGSIERAEGAVLAAGGAVYTVGSFWAGRQRQPQQPVQSSMQERPLPSVALLAGGLGLLVGGSSLLVESATALAQALGISELAISIAVIGPGTSLPELATSAVAALRGARDLSVGNTNPRSLCARSRSPKLPQYGSHVLWWACICCSNWYNAIGSNIFNILGVLGLSSALTPGGLEVASEALRLDLPVMVLVALACWPVCWTGGRIARWEGALFVSYYAAYLAYLLLDALDLPFLPAFGRALFWGALPLTLLVLLASSLHYYRLVRRTR